MARVYVRPVPATKNSSGRRTYYSSRHQEKLIDAIDERRSERGRSRSVEIGNGVTASIGEDGLCTWSCR